MPPTNHSAAGVAPGFSGLSPLLPAGRVAVVRSLPLLLASRTNRDRDLPYCPSHFLLLSFPHGPSYDISVLVPRKLRRTGREARLVGFTYSQPHPSIRVSVEAGIEHPTIIQEATNGRSKGASE